MSTKKKKKLDIVIEDMTTPMLTVMTHTNTGKSLSILKKNLKKLLSALKMTCKIMDSNKFEVTVLLLLLYNLFKPFVLHISLNKSCANSSKLESKL